MDGNLLLIGKVTKPHGIRGKIRIISYAESIDTFLNLDSLYLKDKSGAIVPLHIQSVSPSKGVFILAVNEIDSIDAAKEVRGCDLFMDRTKLPELPDGEYYQRELIGLDVVTTEGVQLGKIRDILPTGSNDVFIVRNKKTEHMIPYLKDVVKSIDLDKGLMVVEPYENMIEGL